MPQHIGPTFNQLLFDSEDMGSKKVFALRKEGKLQEAHSLAISLLRSDQDGVGQIKWTKK